MADGNPLQRSLSLADICLRSVMGTQALSNDENPLRLNLPPLLNGADGITPSPAALRTIATLYFQAELEQAGVISVAEVLAGARRRLTAGSVNAIRKLEIFAQNSRDWYDGHSRDLLFARLFGIGPAATNDTANAVNHDFQRRFAVFCSAITRYGEDYRWGQKPAPAQEIALRQGATHLLVNLGTRQHGNTLIAAQYIQEQLKAAIDLLSDPEIGAIFQARGMWDVLRKILGTETPDLGRLITRGRSGLRILKWLADTIPRLKDEASQTFLLSRGSPVSTWAGAWLNATGISMNRAGSSSQSVARTVGMEEH